MKHTHIVGYDTLSKTVSWFSVITKRKISN